MEANILVGKSTGDKRGCLGTLYCLMGQGTRTYGLLLKSTLNHDKLTSGTISTLPGSDATEEDDADEESDQQPDGEEKGLITRLNGET
jgi:hypothetical protein